MAFKTEVEAIAQHIANQFISSGQELNLSKLIAEAAMEKNYNIEKIKRLIEETNRAVFYELFNTKQDRNVEFPIAKLEEVMKYLNEPAISVESEPMINVENLVDESDFDLSDLALLEAKKQMFEDLPRNKLEEINQEVDNAKGREKEKAIRITITYMKAAAEELKLAAMQEEEFRSKLRELLTQAVKLGLTYTDIDMTLKQALGNTYTPDVQKVINEEYQKIMTVAAQPIKIASSKKEEIGLTIHELEFLESLRELSPQNMKKILELSDKVNPERLRNVVTNTYGPTSMRTKIVDKILQKSKEVLKGTVQDVLKQTIDTGDSPELNTDSVLDQVHGHGVDTVTHKHASWRTVDWLRAVEAEKEIFNSFNDVLRKKAESITDYLKIKEMLTSLASSDFEKRMVLNSIDKKAEEIVRETLIKIAGPFDFLSTLGKYIKSISEQAVDFTKRQAGKTQQKAQAPSPVQNLQRIMPDPKQQVEQMKAQKARQGARQPIKNNPGPQYGGPSPRPNPGPQYGGPSPRPNPGPQYGGPSPRPNPGPNSESDYGYRKKQAEEIAQAQPSAGKGTKFLNKLTEGMNVAGPFLNVAGGVLNIAGGVQTLRSLDLDIKAKKRQLEQQSKYAQIIGAAVKKDLSKLAASAVVPAATQVASKTAPALKKIFNGLKATSNFLNENALLVNLGMGIAQSQIADSIASKQDELNRLNKMGAVQPDWNLLLNSVNLLRGNTSFYAARPYNLEQLKQAIKEKNPDWESEIIDRTINTIANYTPSILEDPYLTEEVIRRVRTYGGFDPNYLEQLQKITERAHNIKANKLTSM